MRLLLHLPVLLAVLISSSCAIYAVGPPARAALGGPLDPGAPYSGQAGLSAGLAPGLSGLSGELSTALRLTPSLVADASLFSLASPANPGEVFVGSVGARFSPPADGAFRSELSGLVSFGCGAATNDPALRPSGCPHHLLNGFGLGGSVGLRTGEHFMLYLAARYLLTFSSTLPWTDWGQLGGGFRVDVRPFFATLDLGAMLLQNRTLNASSAFATLTLGVTWR